MAEEIVGTVVGRWYVTIFGITFLVLASRHLGWRRTGTYAAVALVVGVIAENGSVRWGIPYTRYSFDESLRGQELFVGMTPFEVRRLKARPDLSQVPPIFVDVLSPCWATEPDHRPAAAAVFRALAQLAS